MGKIAKAFALFLTTIVAITCLTLLIVKPVNAQAMPKPSMPEFTLQYADNSYNVPAMYKLDPYTGEKTVDTAGYHVDNRSITVNIRNQPFTPFTDNGTTYYLAYNIYKKGHFEQNWTSFGIFPPLKDNYYTPVAEQTILTRGQIDYKVQAIIGHYENVSQPGRSDIPFPGFDNHPYYEIFTADTESDSNVLTISIPDGTSSNPISTNTNPTPTVPELSWLIIPPLLLTIMFIAIITRYRKVGHGQK